MRRQQKMRTVTKMPKLYAFQISLHLYFIFRIYLCIYILCVSVCVRETKRERQKERDRKRERVGVAEEQTDRQLRDKQGEGGRQEKCLLLWNG